MRFEREDQVSAAQWKKWTENVCEQNSVRKYWHLRWVK